MYEQAQISKMTGEKTQEGINTYLATKAENLAWEGAGGRGETYLLHSP